MRHERASGSGDRHEVGSPAVWRNRRNLDEIRPSRDGFFEAMNDVGHQSRCDIMLPLSAHSRPRRAGFQARPHTKARPMRLQRCFDRRPVEQVSSQHLRSSWLSRRPSHRGSSCVTPSYSGTATPSSRRGCLHQCRTLTTPRHSGGPCAKLDTRLLPSACRVPRMSKTYRRSVPPIVAAVVQPVARRLSRMEALLIEMRYEQDVQLKRFNALLARLDALTEPIKRRNKRRARRQ
jgi:hypothetical protein